MTIKKIFNKIIEFADDKGDMNDVIVNGICVCIIVFGIAVLVKISSPFVLLVIPLMLVAMYTMYRIGTGIILFCLIVLYGTLLFENYL